MPEAVIVDAVRTPIGRAVTGNDLAQIWRSAAIFLPHFAGCTCAGPHLMLDRDAIEADLLGHPSDRT